MYSSAAYCFLSGARRTRGISLGECMSTLPSPIAHSGLRGVWEVVSDLLIATALIWTLPLLLGVVAALVNRLLEIE